ncbi:MAG: O-acetyl-ADP-ribose deacetylase [Spirochaetaceae bacterium]|jgi:O-acetyl-ADP-ribose deacetylase (regulator of RNase III)|nr:O-acetyl-ADP-ribose deacetylase [Spirochaetaceae bacterium]
MTEPRYELIQGDITKLDVDAVVNAANCGLMGGGGVDGAIHRAAGQALYDECEKLPFVRAGVRCPTGEARITGAGKMKCRYIIHTAGPVYGGGDRGEAEKLGNCYANSLRLAAENGVESIAFPNISCGIYGYPLDEAAKIAVETVRRVCAGLPSIKKVIFCCFDRRNFDIYKNLLDASD